MQHDTYSIAIEDLPDLACEAALFDASLDSSDMTATVDHVVISLVLNP